MIPASDWKMYIRSAHDGCESGSLIVESFASKSEGRDGLELTMHTPHGPTIQIQLEDLAEANLFFTRVQKLVAEDAHVTGQRDSTLRAVRHIAHQLVQALDAGDLETVRATLESYALPKGQES